MSNGTATAPELDLDAINQDLETRTAAERIRWAVDVFGDRAALLSSMQKTSSVLMHLFATQGLKNEVIFGDTGFHFHETLQTRDRFVREFGLQIVTVYPRLTPEQQEAKYGRKLHLSVEGQPICCHQRKEEPFLDYVRQRGHRLVMVGTRRGEGGRRAGLRVVARDPRIGGYSLHPIVDWTSEKVAEYLRQHQVPVHPLHAASYPSIGCECCTTPVAPGEDPRAGRWRHLRTESDQPAYCGLNFTDGSGI